MTEEQQQQQHRQQSVSYKRGAAKRRQADTTPLSRWLRENGFYVSFQKNRPLTHVFLNGGKASVPDSARAVFNSKYVESYLLGYELYVVERAINDRFKMFVDIDCKIENDARRGEEDEDRRALNIAYLVLRHMPISASCDAVVCTKKRHIEHQHTGSASCKEPAEKAGVHIVWVGKSAHVSKRLAQDLRNECIARAAANASMSVKEHSVDADDVLQMLEKCVDSAVYSSSSSLRMPLSRKKDSSAVYFPTHLWSHQRSELTTVVPSDFVAVHPSHDALAESRLSLADLLAMCSIHVEQRRSQPDATDKLGDGNANLTTRNTLENEDDEDSYPGMPCCLQTSVSMNETEREIRAVLPEPYKSAPFKKIAPNVSKSLPGLFVALECRYCLNYGKEHKSNHVYLTLNEKGVFQRCFCTCDTTSSRRYGKCRDFSMLLTSDLPSKVREYIHERQRLKDETDVKAPRQKRPRVNTPTASSATELWLQKVEARFSGNRISTA